MLKHTFKVSQKKGATAHEVTIEIPSYAEATEVQRERMWNEGIDSVVIKVQGTLRRRLAAGVRPGERLNAEAQTAFQNVLDNVRTVTVQKTRIDATALELTRKQIDALVAGGAEVYNIPANLAK